jgi:hypothetical protein
MRQTGLALWEMREIPSAMKCRTDGVTLMQPFLIVSLRRAIL